MLISVIIPCHNVEKYIVECVESVLNQTHKEIEILAVDNNSTDNTWSVLEQLAQQFPDKIQALQEKKKGACAARNKGLQLAKGQWIQFLDADDLLLATKISHQLALIVPNENAAFVAGASFLRNVKKEDRVVTVNEQSWFALFQGKLGNTCSNLWRRETLVAVGGWNEGLQSSQEADLMFRVLKYNEQVLVDNTPLTVVRQRESGQISQTDPKGRWTRYLNLRIDIWEYLLTQHQSFFEENKNKLYQAFFDIIRTTYVYIPQETFACFQKYIPMSFSPQVSQTTSKSYVMLYRLLGFKGIENLKKGISLVLRK